MCGIAGIWARQPLQEADIAVMVRALSHRGPDDHDLWITGEGSYSRRLSRAAAEAVHSTARTAILAASGPHGLGVEPPHLALGHTRLAVIDLSPGGHQPMHDPQTGNRIVYNGEVYNFREIRRMLEGRGVRFHSDCDTEVVLQAYAAWGPECVRRFRGMFSFAIWDQDARRLFLARDRMGIKPLYYFYSQDGLVFASELRALLASGRVPRRISQQGLATYLAYGSVTEPETIVDRVSTLQPGHIAVFDGSSLDITRYWGLDGFGWETEAPQLREVTEAVGQLLRESIQLRLISDVPIGAFLSGGIDSSAVVSLMAQAAPGRVRTLSVCFDEAAYDERAHSALVAKQNGTDHRAVVLTAQDVLSHLDDALSSLDQPSVDGINTWFVSRAARQDGLTVALSGLGGDEVFAGYSTFRTSPRLETLRRLVSPAPGCMRRAASRLAGPALHGVTAAGAGKLADLLAFAPHLQHAALMQRALFTPHLAARLLGKPRPEAILPFYRVPAELISGDQSPLRQLSVMECGHYMRNTLLRDTDAMSMAHGLEVRVPLIDHLLVELALGLDDRAKLNRTTPKPLLVHALGATLPASAVHRTKRGFTFPFEVWLRGPLGIQVHDALCSPRSSISRLLDVRESAGVWQCFVEGRVNWSRPWSLFVLNHWAEQNLPS